MFLLAPLVTATLALAAWAVIPLNAGWAIADINVGILYIFAISSLGVYGVIMGGLGLELEIPVPRRAPLGRADGVLRGLDRLRHHHRADVRRVAEPLAASSTAQDTALGHPRLVLAAAVPDVRGLLHLGDGGDEPAALRPAGGGIGARGRLHGRIFLDAVPAVHARRVRGHHDHVRASARILFLGGWLSPIPFAPFTWVPGVIWFILKASFLFFMIAMVKAMVPRYRYDQLMRLGWKVFLPISLAMVVIVAAVLN